MRPCGSGSGHELGRRRALEDARHCRKDWLWLYGDDKRDGSGDVMRLKLEVTGKTEVGGGSAGTRPQGKARDENECVGRQAASEDINLQDDFVERNGLAQKNVPTDFCGVKREGRERVLLRCGSWVCTAGIRFTAWPKSQSDGTTHNLIGTVPTYLVVAGTCLHQT